jgi:hypothetical protein
MDRWSVVDAIGRSTALTTEQQVQRFGQSGAQLLHTLLEMRQEAAENSTPPMLPLGFLALASSILLFAIGYGTVAFDPFGGWFLLVTGAAAAVWTRLGMENRARAQKDVESRWRNRCGTVEGLISTTVADVNNLPATLSVFFAAQGVGTSQPVYNQSVTRYGLIKTLPLLAAAGIATPEVRQRLNLLLSNMDPELARAALKALAGIGDRTSLPHVERLASPSNIFTRADPALISAAQECLKRLRARLAPEEQAARLLRPSDGPGSESLLRPASSAAHAPEALLRPTSHSGEH